MNPLQFKPRTAARQADDTPVGGTAEPGREAAAPLVRVRNLRVDFRDGWAWRRAVAGVSFDVAAGQCVALVGESGSGKSVTARSLIGLHGAGARVSADELALRGRSLLALGERQWRGVRGREIGYILQDALVSLDPLRTIGQELREAIVATGSAGPEGVRARSLALLERARLADGADRLDDHPAQLSGGQRQRALIATALAGNPPVLIADEPTTALDASVQQQILALFAQLKREGAGLVLISHDLGAVAQLADHLLILRRGEVVESGPAAQVLRAPQHAYTRALIAAVPRLGDAGVGPGEAPSGARRELLRAEGIVKHYTPTRQALRGVDLVLHEGRTLGLVGESGSGKTTLARIIAGLESASAGRIVPGPALLAAAAGRARPIQFVYQDPLSAFDPRHTVQQILAEALRLRFGRESRARQRQRVAEWLVRVGLPPDLGARRPLTLSGGQRQRVAIARALAVEPRLVVMDEPVSALDVSVQQQILVLIATLQRDTGVAFLFISHDLGVIQQVSHDVAVLRHGELREAGPAHAVLSRPRDDYTRELIAAVAHLPA
ncbi:MAG: Glutathione import ATP-binding protein GsiA [Paracidovorax wautersii]|uniref:Glutathione import ATP-binding protein GsiA n=1 Tax=Paracidovorax wautersii TaxID=1177982 RepID=A0A7V8JRH2_9BURK|nr:MAG: Glutathione import ATP-binding protein GsiA [Paracidovorax wautersii]